MSRLDKKASARKNSALQQQDHLQLASGAVVTGKFGSSRLLQVKRGRVWMTQAGRAEDFWLGAGDAIIVQPGRLIVIEAAIASEIELEKLQPSLLATGLRWCGKTLAAVQNRWALLIGFSRSALRNGAR